MFFEPTFATCKCRDCGDVPTYMPSSSPIAFPTLATSELPSSASPIGLSPRQPDFSPTNGPSAVSSEVPSRSLSSIPSIHSSTAPSIVDPSASPSLEPTRRPTTSPSLSFSESPSESPSGSFYPSTAPTDYPTKTLEPSSSPSIYPSGLPSYSPTALPSDAPSTSPSEYPSVSLSVSPTSDPVTYRCPPSSDPTDENDTSVTPSPIGVSGTTATPTNRPTAELSTDSPRDSSQSPTDLISTEFPTTFNTFTSSNPFTTPPFERPTDESCVDTSECIIFAVGNCVDKITGDTCFPPGDTRSRRALEKKIEFHQAALEDLIYY